jgi:hypothetical protein
MKLQSIEYDILCSFFPMIPHYLEYYLNILTDIYRGSIPYIYIRMTH